MAKCCQEVAKYSAQIALEGFLLDTELSSFSSEKDLSYQQQVTEDAMKMILLCAALLILGMQAGCTKSCAEKHWFDGRAFSECVRLGNR